MTDSVDASIHICCTLRHAEQDIADQLVADLAEAVAAVRANPKNFAEMAPIYGMAATMPDRGVIRDFVSSYLDVVLQV